MHEFEVKWGFFSKVVALNIIVKYNHVRSAPPPGLPTQDHLSKQHDYLSIIPPPSVQTFSIFDLFVVKERLTWAMLFLAPNETENIGKWVILRDVFLKNVIESAALVSKEFVRSVLNRSSLFLASSTATVS